MRFTAQKEAIPRLVQNLRRQGYVVVGPSLSDGVVRLMEINGQEDLASGVLDVQAPGRYRAEGREPFVFSSVNGPDSPKKYLHPAEVELAKYVEGDKGVEQVSAFRSERKYAFFGLRPCDLRGVDVMDRTMMVPGFEDPVYSSLRKDSIFVVVNCTRAGENCFCASMGTGPEADSGYDVAITELSEKLLLDVPERSMKLFRGIELHSATEEELHVAGDRIRHAREQMGRRIAEDKPAKSMYAGIDSPEWGKVAERCLACGNCTMVCPTCFCNTIGDRTDLRDGSVSRVRRWDSCLSKDFTYSAGGNPRQNRIARYRQFVMHKFAYWPDEFGIYGCVGCGRCITWCPVGIDITETVNGVLKGQREKAGNLEAPRVV
jgi:sulfhydrogenase subunit beta (sulfur reductase)